MMDDDNYNDNISNNLSSYKSQSTPLETSTTAPVHENGVWFWDASRGIAPFVRLCIHFGRGWIVRLMLAIANGHKL